MILRDLDKGYYDVIVNAFCIANGEERFIRRKSFVFIVS